MYQTGGTIKDTLDSIQRNVLVLPAIQREFVWDQEQICHLFDSLMQGYPFGTFLYWQVNPENSHKFKFYDFVREYHQRDNPHCPPLPTMHSHQLTAVLDGQQRLTALNIGLRGSIAVKLPRRWWNNPDAFPKRKFYLDLLWQPNDEDNMGWRYRFAFLTNREYRRDESDDNVCWFPVSDVLAMSSGPDLVKWVTRQVSHERIEYAHETLDTLYQVVHNKLLIAYYQENNQDLEKVLQVFTRTNSGGTVLSYSDLLLSVAVAQWGDYDARNEIHNLVDDLNRIGAGFTFSKDLVLKAGLMLSDIGSVGFKVDNFNRENMSIFEGKWESIKRALALTVQLVSSFGFSGQNLRAVNSILPIAYYLHANGYGENYLVRAEYVNDRRAIREWLIRSLLKSGVWGSGLDTLLTALRQVIQKDGRDSFPVARIREEMARRGKSLVFEDEEVEDLADTRYGSPLGFALLSLLFPFVDLSHEFHIDHIFPRKRFTRRNLIQAGACEEVAGEFIDNSDRLANLQLLQGGVNLEKSAKMPSEWLRQAFPDKPGRRQYVESHMFGNVPDSVKDFGGFYDARRERLKAKIAHILGRASVSGGRRSDI